MTGQNINTGIQHKLMLKLLEFVFQMEYKKGRDNIVVDALPRKYSLNAIYLVTPNG